VAKMVYNSVAYTTNVVLNLLIDTAVVPQGSIDDFLDATADRIVKGYVGPESGSADSQIIANKALLLKAESGNPAAGNSDIEIIVRYRIISI